VGVQARHAQELRHPGRLGHRRRQDDDRAADLAAAVLPAVGGVPVVQGQDQVQAEASILLASRKLDHRLAEAVTTVVAAVGSPAATLPCPPGRPWRRRRRRPAVAAFQLVLLNSDELPVDDGLYLAVALRAVLIGCC